MVERTPLLARSFQTLLGIRTYVQKSIRYLEKVRRRSNFASLLNRITIIMFADNFLMLTVTVAFFFLISHYKSSIFLSCSCCLLCLPSALGGFSHVHIRSFWVLLSLNSCRLIRDRAEFFSVFTHKRACEQKIFKKADKWTRSFGPCHVANIADNKNPCTCTHWKRRKT